MGRNKTKQVKRAALYLRVSTPKGRKLQDPENQRPALEKLAKKRGWKVTSTYVDHDLGGKASGLQFQQMFEDAKAGKFDVVLFWALDRFSGEGLDKTTHLLCELDSYGVGWISCTDQFLDSTGPSKDTVIGTIAAIAALAEMEHKRISSRTKAGLKRAVAEGKTLGRPRKGVTKKQLEALLQEHTVPHVARSLGISRTTIYNRLKEGSQ